MSTQNKYEFKAEIKKLLQILSKSLYQHKEIFLRELISNSSDALKKMHFISISTKDFENPEIPMQIEVVANSKDKTIIVRDTGLGMTKQELIDSLGTIAASGTEKFLKTIKDSQDKKEKIDLDVIGQFGVGFYSVFMIADKVQVISKSYLKGEPAQLWESDGSGEFTISSAEKSTRGTDIILYIKEEDAEFLSQSRLESIIKKYSNFISFPIFVSEIKPEEKKKQEVDAGEDKKEEKKEGEDKKEEKKEEEKPPEKKPVNEIEPIWKKTANDIKEEQYKNFYHFISNRYDDYSHVINYAVDGQVQFHSIFYIPDSRTKELMQPDVEFGLTLYTKNVMIMQNCKDLVPSWLRFIKGMVDSDDIPLNISRETIQTNRYIMKINDLLTKKFIGEMQSLLEKDSKKYQKIWDEFGIFIKEGIVSDHVHKEKLVKLLRFHTSKTKSDEMKTLDEYIKTLPKDKTEIYYLIGENLSTLKVSPHLGYYNKNNLEVILFNEPIDNFLMMNVHDYKISVTEGEKTEEKTYTFKGIDVTAETEKKTEKKEGEDKKEEEPKKDVPEDIKKFLDNVRSILGDKITDATSSDQLYDNPCRLANPAGGMTSSMQRVMRYWTQTKGGKEFQIPRKVIEFNPNHPLIKDLIKINNENPNNGKIKPVVKQLFENCLLVEGDLPEPANMVPRMNQILEMFITGNENVRNPVEEEEEKAKKEAEEKEKKEKEEQEKKAAEEKDKAEKGQKEEKK